MGKLSTWTELTTPAPTDYALVQTAGGANRRVRTANLPIGTQGYTAPVAGDFTWVNQGGASLDTSGLGLTMRCPATSALNFRLQSRAAPAPPYTVTAAIQFTPLAVNSHFGGIGWRQADGKLIAIGLQYSGSLPLLLSVKCTAPGTFSATYFSVAARLGTAPAWLRLADDGTNRICSVSPDGKRWLVVHTVGRTDFLTATEVFWAGDPSNATYDLLFTLLSWQVT